jgi:hypothetical protein
MKTIFSTFILLCAFANCKTAKPIYKSETIAGKYYQEEDNSFELILNSNSSFLYYKLPDGHRTASKLSTEDTIAYGHWALESKGWIVVSSPPSHLKPLKISVEETSNQNADTVYIKINSPLQDLLEHSFAPTIATYAVSVLVMNAFLEQINPSSTSNVIKLYNPKKLPVQSISLVIYPEPHYFDNLIFGNYNEGFKAGITEIYGMKTNASNQFVINIPDLTEGYLICRKLNRDFLKIINETHVEWEGHIFIREKTK